MQVLYPKTYRRHDYRSSWTWPLHRHQSVTLAHITRIPPRKPQQNCRLEAAYVTLSQGACADQLLKHNRNTFFE
jgi:hypothetical protein